MTLVLPVTPESPDDESLARAASVIQSGGLVAFPTETVYGLGADAMNESAVQKIFRAKGRPADNPLIVHVYTREMLDRVALMPGNKAELLIDMYWPGPLTLVFNRRAEVAPSVSAGLDTVAVRMPDHPVALAFISRAGTPLAAPSANRSGRPSPTSAAHVMADLDGRIDLVLDGGSTNIGIESTVLDVTADPPTILRPGWITEEHLTRVIGRVRSSPDEAQLMRSPGTRYRHYSPRARMILCKGGDRDQIDMLCRDLPDRFKIGFVGYTRPRVENPNLHTIILDANAIDYGRRLYSVLRELDDRGIDVIIVEAISEQGEGMAVMDRLRRAASEVRPSTQVGKGQMRSTIREEES
jgi:L-threonylcarbamoyladenylate synthase